MRSFQTGAVALLLVLALHDSHAGFDILAYDGGAPGAGFEYRDEDDFRWDWREGLIGDPMPDGDVFADAVGHPGWICDVCRDPQMHTIDYAAMAYNAYFGENPWAIDSILGIPFRVYNLELDWVVIWFEDVVFDFPTTHPDTLEVAIRLRSGQIKRLELLQGGPDLPIGEPKPASSGGGADGGEDDDDFEDDFGEYDDDIFDEIEIDDPTGVVEIEDPDENGEFEEWAEEL